MILLVKAFNNYIDKDLRLSLKCDEKVSWDNYLEREFLKEVDMAKARERLELKRFAGWQDGDVVNIYDDDAELGSRENYPRFYQARIDTKNILDFFKVQDKEELKKVLQGKETQYIIDTTNFKDIQVNDISTNKLILRKDKVYDMDKITEHNSAGTYTVGPGKDYSNLSNWEAGEQCDLTGTAGCVADCFSFQDTLKTSINGWTTTSTARITIQATSTARHLGVWTTSAYRLVCTATADDDRALYLSEDYITVDGIQISMTDDGYGYNYIAIIENANQGASNDITIKKVIGYHTTAGTNNFGIVSSNTNAKVTIWNSVIYSNGDGNGFYSYQSSTYTVRNSVAYHWNIGCKRDSSGGTYTATNVTTFNNSYSDWDGTITATYCASDDSKSGTGNFQITQSASGYAAFVTSASGGNFYPTNTSSELYNTGTDLSAYFTDDIRGYTRSQWDVGAFEYGASEGSKVFVTTEPTGGAAGTGKIYFDNTNNRILFQTDLGSGYVTRGYIDSTGTHDGAP